MRELELKVEQWKAMPRGSASDLLRADAYFDEVLMPLAAQKFRRHYEEAALPPYYGMFLTVGTSWQPMALSITAIKPQNIGFICTEETQGRIEKIAAFLHLPEKAYDVFLVKRSDAAAIYEVMEKKERQWRQGGRCCADVTGGTKAMASCAAMMAAVLGLDIYYIESAYLSLYRRPMPGSERLERLLNPVVWRASQTADAGLPWPK